MYIWIVALGRPLEFSPATASDIYPAAQGGNAPDCRIPYGPPGPSQRLVICQKRFYVPASRANLASMARTRSTTILCVRRNGQTAIGGDGQVSMGNTVMKGGARKIRRLDGKDIVAGFAGSAADAFTLFELFEKKVEQYRSQLSRAAVELAREWRTDRMLRRLEALLIVADPKEAFLISGTGDVISSDDGILAIGSGGNYALAAARALLENTDMSARDIVDRAMNIAGDICVFTNNNISIEVLEDS